MPAGRGTGRDRPVRVGVSVAQPSPTTGAAGADCGESRTRARSAADGPGSRSGCGPGARVGIRRIPAPARIASNAAVKFEPRSRIMTLTWCACRASRSQAVSRVVRRNMNRRHMTGGHRGGTAGSNFAGQSHGRDPRHAQDFGRATTSCGLRNRIAPPACADEISSHARLETAQGADFGGHRTG